MIDANETGRYKKRTDSDVSKIKNKSKHKHQYVDVLISVRPSNSLYTIGNKNVRYILTAISVGITVFALVQLSTDIGTALFGVEGVNARMPKPNP